MKVAVVHVLFTATNLLVAGVAVESNNPRGAANLPGIGKFLSDYELILGLVAVLFGLVVLFVQYRLVVNGAVRWTADQIIRMSMLTLIITGTLFIVAAGFDTQQIAPAVGLFGTIAGYLLGIEKARKAGEDDDEKT